MCSVRGVMDVGFLMGKLRQGGEDGGPHCCSPAWEGVFSHLVVSGSSWHPRMGVLGRVTLLSSWAGSH